MTARLTLMLLAAAAPLGVPGEVVGTAEVTMVPCTLERVSSEASCGVLLVPEDRSNPNGRTIPLRLVVLKATGSAVRADPIFGLAGGPGTGAARWAWVYAQEWDFALRSRDIVLVDQRGTGASGPLSCTEVAPEISAFSATLFPVDFIEACREHLAPQADVRHYTSVDAAADLDDVRRALGYGAINVWGESYGTRLALEYIRRFGVHVRTAVLDGVAPTSLKMPLYFARDSQNALDHVLAACEAQETCRTKFPDLGSRFSELLARLDQAPRVVRVEDEEAGQTAVTMGRAAIGYAVRGMLYGSNREWLPLLIHRATRDGDLSAFASYFSRRGSWPARDEALGMYLTIVCSEDMVQVDASEKRRATQGTFLGDTLVRQFEAACDRWPTRALDPGYFELPQSDVPTLLLAGEFDPVTPPAHAREVRRRFSRSALIVAKNAGHSAGSTPCGRQRIENILETGSAGADQECVLEGGLTFHYDGAPFR